MKRKNIKEYILLAAHFIAALFISTVVILWAAWLGYALNGENMFDLLW